MESLDGQHFDALIIGAGMSGLAAAIRLAHFGKKTLLLERHNAIGGLNGFYFLGGRKYDVGLHAMTNFVPAGAKNAPLTKLLRQLRIRYDELDLCPQKSSSIHAFGNKIRFSNDFALLESEIARTFPRQIDGFRKLDVFLSDYNETALDAADTSARTCVSEFIDDPLLVDTLFIPLSFYGSSLPDDMALPQFAIMWRSIFREGFARPHIGVRQITRTLQRKLRESGAVVRMKCGVKKILTDGKRAVAVELDNGETVSAGKILSSAGSAETLRLCEGIPENCDETNIGQLAFCETITQLNANPEKDFGWDETIIFFNDAERFSYRNPDALIDPRSGVICIPNNYIWRDPASAPQEGCLRVTCLADYARWKALGHASEAYTAAKTEAFSRLRDAALSHLPAVEETRFRDAVLATDMFTPLTVERFTGKLGGAIYGATQKNRTGKTPFENLFLCGTDQGFLGITGAILSGISMANLHMLS